MANSYAFAGTKTYLGVSFISERLEELIQRYSEFITFPIKLYKKSEEIVEVEEEEDEEEDSSSEEDSKDEGLEVEEEDDEDDEPAKTEKVP